jgi:hypothetical protein
VQLVTEVKSISGEETTPETPRYLDKLGEGAD